MTTSKLQPVEFLERAKLWPVIDVRSPKEFCQGHIPGAYNIPIFSDSEHATVGTTYSNKGSHSAILMGLEIIGPKLVELVTQARKAAPAGEVLVHCWRGGMRSEAMAWLLNFSGMKALVLEGGYRGYRRYIREKLSTGPSLRIIGGMTGSGKTEILHHLSASGEQVIDLEGLAHHKGSAFGWLGQEEQPTTEQFENDLANQWLSMNPSQPVWVEDESLNIGKVVIPDVFFQKMRSSPMYFINLSFGKRVGRLMQEYGSFDREGLQGIIMKISRRMGGDLAKIAIDSLIQGDVRKSIEIVLDYYDKTYHYSLERRTDMQMQTIDGDGFTNHRAIANHLKTIL